MGVFDDLKADLKDVAEGDNRDYAVNRFARAMLDAVKDAKLTDEEVNSLCFLYEELGISNAEWESLREEIWTAAVSAAETIGLDEARLMDLCGIRAFLGTQEGDGS